VVDGSCGACRGEQRSCRQRGRPGDRAESNGLRSLRLSDGRDGLIALPTEHHAGVPAALVVMMHGAGGKARDAVAMLRGPADEAGIIVMAPESRGRTWDFSTGGANPDVDFLIKGLEVTLRRHPVDPSRLAVAGFSDGASFALALGLAHGDLFTHVMAFAPGFPAPERSKGRPRLFVAHGTRDDVLPIHLCGRPIVSEVRRAGYDVAYREFDGPHALPAEIAGEAIAWFGGRADPDLAEGVAPA